MPNLIGSILISLLIFCFRAVVDHSEGEDLPSVSVESFEYFPGRGLVATVNGNEVSSVIN